MEPSEELQSLYRQIGADKSSPPVPVAVKVPASATIPHNLPPRLTSFVGREGKWRLSVISLLRPPHGW